MPWHAAQVYFAREYDCYAPNSLLLDNALATMGAGVPSAMAAKLVKPEVRNNTCWIWTPIWRLLAAWPWLPDRGSVLLLLRQYKQSACGDRQSSMAAAIAHLLARTCVV